jgi:class 3 adenylate cyclase
MLDAMYDQAPVTQPGTIVELPLNLYDNTATEKAHHAYATFFREGIFYILKPEGPGEESLLDFLMRRDEIIRTLLRKRLPVLTNVAVLVADLQNSVKICSELPPEEYFELINELYSTMAPIFRKYYGTHGKHAGDGLLYYFFPRPDSDYVYNAVRCAQEIRIQTLKLSKNWQIKKNWLNELYLNIGLTEGQEWVGTYQTATSVEFVVLGDTINHAARLSDFARFGSIWATKGFLGKLSSDDRNRVRFGVSRTTADGRQVFVPSSYAMVSSLVDFTVSTNEKLRDIAAFPVTEVVDVALN